MGGRKELIRWTDRGKVAAIYNGLISPSGRSTRCYGDPEVKVRSVKSDVDASTHKAPHIAPPKH